MKWLSIDCTKAPAVFMLAHEGGKGFGTLRNMPDADMRACAVWLARVGGRELLDSFELALIQDGVIRINVHDAEGYYYRGHWECQDVKRLDHGMLLFWERKCACESCNGVGNFTSPGDLVDLDDICTDCGGTGLRFDTSAITDMDGLLIDPPSLN